jgi:DNA-binding transcriptional MerR regulator
MATTTPALTISEAARSLGVSVHTLRYYERTGLIDAVDRSANDHRRYGPADLDWVAFLLRLRATGMPIREMREYAEQRRAGASTFTARHGLLEAHRARVVAALDELRASLDLIERKIQTYREST